MKFKELIIVTEDNLKLFGWLIYAKKDPQNTNTILFFHENAGSKIILIFRYWNEITLYKFNGWLSKCKYDFGWI